MHCAWCHNPESVSPQRQIQFYPEKCIACGRCVRICPNGAHVLVGEGEGEDVQRVYCRDLCVACGNCAEECFAGALVVSGKAMTVKEVMAELEKDEDYYRTSGGGVTFSGGEPLLQAEFLTALLQESQARGYHTAVDTAGHVPWEILKQVLPYTDLFLYDVKTLNKSAHQRATGVSNRRIVENLQKLADGRIEVHIRIPLIPGVNDSEEEMEEIATLLCTLPGITLIEVLPFHHLGSNKYDSLGKPYPSKALSPPSKERLEEVIALFREKGLPAQSYLKEHNP